MPTKPDISYVIIMGDSLSDRGTMYHRQLFHFIRMSVQSGLKGKAAVDSFTNGLPWSDHFIAALANDFVIQEIKKEKYVDASNIADEIITRESKAFNSFRKNFNLKNDLLVKYRDTILARTYIEGGLTADNYSRKSDKKFCFSPGLAICREILSNLEKKRKLLLADDKKYNISAEQKSKTLVIEWSGANDLITVNKTPTKENADYAINARIKNINELIKNGYRQFVLFNLPNIALTLRYHNKNNVDRDNAKIVSEYFNKKLKMTCEELKSKHANCTIDLFDVNELFLNIYNNPEKFNIDRKKLNQAFLKTKDFHIKPNHTSPATGYMFWDDVHPTADVHAIIAYQFYEKYKRSFNFCVPLKKRYKNLCKTRTL